MPIYEYQCPNNHTWDHMRRMKDRNSPSPCPECDEDGTRISSLQQRPIVYNGTAIHHKRD